MGSHSHPNSVNASQADPEVLWKETHLNPGQAKKVESDSSPTTAASEDALLLEALINRDREAFSVFVDRQHGFVLGYLRSRLLDLSDAEDLCQEVFLRCYLGKVKFRRDVAVRPWLLGVARNVLREHIRKVTKRKEVAWTELCLELDSMVIDNHADYNQSTLFLKQCISDLGNSAQQALQLHYYAKLKMQQIGEKLKRSEGAVKLLVYRARQALKNCITKKLQVHADD